IRKRGGPTRDPDDHSHPDPRGGVRRRWGLSLPRRAPGEGDGDRREGSGDAREGARRNRGEEAPRGGAPQGGRGDPPRPGRGAEDRARHQGTAVEGPRGGRAGSRPPPERADRDRETDPPEGGGAGQEAGDGRAPRAGEREPVSYTHLTLPTIYSV